VLARLMTAGHGPCTPSYSSLPQIAGSEQQIIFMNSNHGKRRNLKFETFKTKRWGGCVDRSAKQREAQCPSVPSMDRNCLIGLEKMPSDQQSKSAFPAAPASAAEPTLLPEDPYSGLVSSTVKYLLRTEVHTFAFSVAANAILSFFSFVLLLMTVIRHVFHSPVMNDVVVQLLRDTLPAGQDFVIRNLNALVDARNRAQVASLIILLFTSTGIFMPLEVALNRIWRFPNNRSYFGNQLISLALAFTCGVLALLSVALTAGNIGLLENSLRSHGPFVVRLGGFLLMKAFAVSASIAIFFLIYWVLPNGKVPARAVLPTAILMGLMSEALKYAYIMALPRLNFQEVYGPFALSVSLMFWAFLTGLLMLTGAHLSARGYNRRTAL
jgi:membrane protein